MDTAAQTTEPKTPYEAALEAFDRQAAVVNAQMGFMHAQILPPKHVGTSLDDIDNAHDLMMETFGRLQSLAEEAGVELPESTVAKFDMLNNSYNLFRDNASAPSDAMIISLT